MTRRTCLSCGRYAYHRCRYCGWIRNPTCPPDHHRKVVMAVRLRGTGTPEHMTMSSRKAAQMLGAQKGGLAIAAAGTAHRWTSESARKAAVKSWTKRRKFNKRIGARVGMKTNRRPNLWREPLRAYYREHPTRGVQWVAHPIGHAAQSVRVGDTVMYGYWKRVYPDGTERHISERAALTALGHLSSKRGFIPDSVMAVKRKSDKEKS